jgi:hypothetical protein
MAAKMPRESRKKREQPRKSSLRINAVAHKGCSAPSPGILPVKKKNTSRYFTLPDGPTSTLCARRCPVVTDSQYDGVIVQCATTRSIRQQNAAKKDDISHLIGLKRCLACGMPTEGGGPGRPGAALLPFRSALSMDSKSSCYTASAGWLRHKRCQFREDVELLALFCNAVPESSM